MNYANDWNQHPDPNENPYAAPTSIIEDDYGAEYDPWAGRALATRGQRLAAAMIDGLAVGMVAFLFAFAMVFGGVGGGGDTLLYVFGGLGGIIFLGIAVYNLMRLHSHQQTIGKQVMGIQIIRADLQTPATLARIFFIRMIPMGLIQMIPFVGGLIAGLVDPLMIFQETQQCMHDMIADTNVVVFEE